MAATLQLTAKEDVTKTLFKLEQQNLRLIAQNKRLAGASRRGTASAKRDFDSLTKSVGRTVTSILGIGSATAVAVSAFRELKAARDEAAREARTSEMALGELAQLSIGEGGKVDEKKYRRLVAIAKETFAGGGAETLGQAAATTFALESAGLLEQREVFQKLRAAGVVHDTAMFARAAKTIIASMGEKEAGTAEALMSKAFAVSQYAPSRAEQLLEAAARGGTGARALGISDEELLAGTAIISAATGTAERAGTQMASLMKSLRKITSGETGGGAETGTQQTIGMAFGRRGKALSKKVFAVRGLPLIEQLEGIQEGMAGLTDAEKMKLFGRQEALKAFEVLLLNAPRYREAAAATEAAQGKKLAAQLAALPGIMPVQAATRAARQAKAAETISAEPLGIKTNLFEAARSVRVKALRDGRFKTGIPAEWEIALTKVFDATFGILPGHERNQLALMLSSGALKGKPELENQIIEMFRNTGAIVTTLENVERGIRKIEENTRRTGEGTDQIEKNTRGPAPVAVQENVTQHGER